MHEESWKASEPSDLDASFRSFICDVSLSSRVIWSDKAVLDGKGDVGSENDGETGREVWMPISRWNSSVGSLSLSSSSGSSCRDVETSCGVSDTIPRSLAINLSRFCCAVPASSCRDEVSAAIMGVIR